MDASPQMRRNYDLPLDQPVLRAAFMERVHPEDRERVAALIDEARRTGRRIAAEHRVVHHSGDVRRMLSTLQVFLRDGEPTHAFGTSQDVTALRVAEEALARETRSLEKAEEVAGVGSWELDVNTWAATWSANLYKLYGVDPGKTMPSFDAFRKLLHPDDEKATVSLVREAVKAGRDAEFTCRIVRPDGLIRTFHQRHHVIRDEAGAPVRLVGVGIDVTEREHEHAALRRLNAIVQASDDAIVGTTLDGIVHSWNSGAERATGWSAQEMVGRPLSEVIAPDRAENAAAALDKVRHGESVQNMVSAIVTRDGRRVGVVVSLWPVFDGSERVVGVSSISRHLPGDANGNGLG
jgi:PAS domain S-box-containing protein